MSVELISKKKLFEKINAKKSNNLDDLLKYINEHLENLTEISRYVPIYIEKFSKETIEKAIKELKRKGYCGSFYSNNANYLYVGFEEEENKE